MPYIVFHLWRTSSSVIRCQICLTQLSMLFAQSLLLHVLSVLSILGLHPAVMRNGITSAKGGELGNIRTTRRILTTGHNGSGRIYFLPFPLCSCCSKSHGRPCECMLGTPYVLAEVLALMATTFSSLELTRRPT